MNRPPSGLCECHAEPMFWNKDARRTNGGYWQCRIQKRERERIRTDKTRARDLRHYHAPNGGYIRRRRHHLADRRQEILNQLAQLEREAAA